VVQEILVLDSKADVSKRRSDKDKALKILLSPLTERATTVTTLNSLSSLRNKSV